MKLCWLIASNVTLEENYYLLLFCSVMHFQDWFRSLGTSTEGAESEDTRSLWPSSLALSRRSLLGLGAVASLTAYYLLMRPRPMRPPCDLQAQSVPVKVSVRQQRRADTLSVSFPPC